MFVNDRSKVPVLYGSQYAIDYGQSDRHIRNLQRYSGVAASLYFGTGRAPQPSSPPTPIWPKPVIFQPSPRSLVRNWKMATKADLFLEIISPLLLHSKAGLGEEQTSIDLNWNRPVVIPCLRQFDFDD